MARCDSSLSGVLAALAVALVLVAASAQRVAAEYDASDGSGGDGWRYLADFCFDYYRAGETPAPDQSMRVDVKLITLDGGVSGAPQGMVVALYDDEQWSEVYKNDATDCAQKLALARYVSPAANWTAVVDAADKAEWSAATYFVSQDVHPRFWYVVAANCQSFPEIQWQIQFWNRGGQWVNQFGVNEQGMNSLFVAWFSLWTVVTIAHICGVLPLWRREPLHPILKLLTAAVVFEWLAITAQLIHYVAFTNNGVGSPPAHYLSILLRVAARLCFILLLVLLANGWTISTFDLDSRARRRIGQILLVFLVLYFAMLLWDIFSRDSADTEYVYDSIPGAMVCVVDVLVAVWFVGTLKHTHKYESAPHKKQLYRRLGWYVLWLVLSQPFPALLALALPVWQKELAAEAITTTADCVAYAVMVFILWPSRAVEYFQLTTPDVQADIMSAGSTATRDAPAYEKVDPEAGRGGN